MNVRVIIDAEMSRTLYETMQRAGFTLKPDGTAMQVQIPNSPSIPRRKTKVQYIIDQENKNAEKQKIGT